MEKALFKKILIDCLTFFIIALLSSGIIIWVFQAVNFLDIIIEDGRSFLIYVNYTLLNFPKIISKLLPFSIFFSFWYMIAKYELNNELIILWNNGVNKFELVNFFLKISILITILQILINTFLIPNSLKLSRTIIKTSNVDFVNSFIKPKKFNDTIDGLTIYSEGRDNNDELNKIYLKRKLDKEKFQITYAKRGKFKNENGINILTLFDGETINVNKNQFTNFTFTKSDLNLSNFKSNTITSFKIQETTTKNLILCVKRLLFENTKKISHNCDKKNLDNIFEELFKRVVVPLYIPVLTLISLLLIIKSKEQTNFFNQRILTFILGVITIIFSESSLKFISDNLYNNFTILIMPLMILLFLYFVFIYKFKFKIKN